MAESAQTRTEKEQQKRAAEAASQRSTAQTGRTRETIQVDYGKKAQQPAERSAGRAAYATQGRQVASVGGLGTIPTTSTTRQQTYVPTEISDGAIEPTVVPTPEAPKAAQEIVATPDVKAPKAASLGTETTPKRRRARKTKEKLAEVGEVEKSELEPEFTSTLEENQNQPVVQQVEQPKPKLGRLNKKQKESIAALANDSDNMEDWQRGINDFIARRQKSEPVTQAQQESEEKPTEQAQKRLTRGNIKPGVLGISGPRLRKISDVSADVQGVLDAARGRELRDARGRLLDFLGSEAGRRSELEKDERLRNFISDKIPSLKLLPAPSGNAPVDDSFYSPENRLEYSVDDVISSQLRADAIASQQEDDARREAEQRRSESLKHSGESYERYKRLKEAKRREINKVRSTDFDEDQAWNKGFDVTELGTDKLGMVRKIIYESFKKVEDTYHSLIERSPGGGLTIDQYEANEGMKGWDPRQKESRTLRKLRGARNMMRMMFLNPTMLHIEGERVETRIEYDSKGRKHIYARRVYNADGNDDVDHAITGIRQLYDCSTRNVMQLVILRAGLGISTDGKIAHKSINDFELTRDQFIELCSDIRESQILYGHPFGLIEGTPSAVRDDSGMFVVVAGTRCFPMGYMPLELMHDLKRSVRSDLHRMSDKQIQDMISQSWLNDTYPKLCANTRGNLMWQARAIENMMRALMEIDGRNPHDLKIPDVTIRQNKMMLEAEHAIRTYGDIETANEIKRKRYNEEAARVRARYMRPMGSRASTKGKDPGEIESDNMKRKRWMIGDWFGNLNMLQRAAKAANIAVMITSVPEALVADGTQRLGYFLTEGMLRRIKPEIMRNYEFTPDLERISRSREAVEAVQVGEAIYRIGGHDMLDVFLNEKRDADGRAMNHMTRRDLHDFLQRWGVTSGNQLSDRLREALKVEPGEEAGFMSNLSRAMELLDAFQSGTNLSQTNQSVQFVRMSMTEMALAASLGSDTRQSYTNDQVQQWGEGKTGGEELIRSLMDTDAGREAFMTQGVTGLARKSPYEHAMRKVLSKNRVTEFAVRSMFDRFPEYGVNKVMNMVPYSNTMSYLAARGVSSLGDLLQQAQQDGVIADIGGAMSRVQNYQVGGRMGFAEGLLKNVMYDTIMAGSRIMIGAIYCGVIMNICGGIRPPKEKKNLYVWSEWRLGTDEQSMPIKWAWFMDDLSGVGLPIGMAWAICLQNQFGADTKRVAANVFIDAIANLNRGTAIMDAIDLVNNFDQEWELMNKHGYEVSDTEWRLTTMEQIFWDVIGDATPTFVGQLIPWSKDYIFKRGDAHTYDKIYDTGGKYSLDEAKNELHLRRPDDYQDYMRRRASQSNVLMAMFCDLFMDSDTSYKYGEMPVDTMVDQYTMQYWNEHYLDLEDPTDIPYDDPEDRIRELDIRAEAVLKDLNNFATAREARMSGFILNPDARENCIRYCYRRIDDARQEMRERTKEYLLTREYNEVMDSYYSTYNYYDSLVDDFLLSKEIPWGLPRYVRQEGDTETRYVDENGNPMTYLDTIRNDTMRDFMTGIAGGLTDMAGLGRVGSTGGAKEEQYLYGNLPGGILPFTSPEDTGAYNYETPAWWNELGDNGKPLIDENGNAVLDSEGNPVMDEDALERMRATNQGMYDRATEMGPVSQYAGRYSGMDIPEMYWGGQGSNMYDENSEDFLISPTGTPTINTRGYRFMEEQWPEYLNQLRDDLKAASESGEGGTSDDDSDDDGWGSRVYPKSYTNGYRYPASYGRKPYSSYSSGRGGSANYNPKIYSTSRSVSGSRAAGLGTRSPYKATTTYLHPNFYTKGSSEAYKRSDI